jgi:hypothetical protein
MSSTATRPSSIMTFISVRRCQAAPDPDVVHPRATQRAGSLIGPAHSRKFIPNPEQAMSTLIQINVTNNSPYLQNFFFFQQPAIYAGGPQVYSNSLLTTPLQPFTSSGSVYTFLLNLQYYAGVQQQFAPPQIGKPSGYSSAIQAIGLTPAPGGIPTSNCTTMTVSPGLALSVPVTDSAVQPGAFRIVSPSYNPALQQYNGGSALQLGNGAVVLSNFVTVMPANNLDCQPILKFYVQTGSYTPGTVMNFTQSSTNAALCDATSGFTTFNVVYNADGTWTVTPSTSRLQLSTGRGALAAVEAVQLNADIMNEAGTAVICRGHAASFNAPVVIDSLTNPDRLHLWSEYQVGPSNGPFKGRMCTALNDEGNSATFN